MTDSAASGSAPSGNVCYRHPDRQSYVLCQRCGRTICSECQTQAAVGVHCPECVREARASAPRTKPAIVTTLTRKDAPIVTYAIMALCVIMFIPELLLGSAFINQVVYFAPYTLVEPWRLVTHLFAHSTQFPYIHILFNLFTLFMFGPVLERMLGRARFIALYFLSGFGGAVAVLLLAPGTPVLGASGAIFGLVAAYFVIQRRLGFSNPTLLIVIVLNLAIGFFPGSNISWQGHLGGLIVGAAVAFVYLRTRQRSQRGLQVALVGAVAVALVAIILLRFFVF